ncbi:MAG: N-acetylmuramoyl-L-alanine amidase [Pseudomonadota bacterium]
MTSIAAENAIHQHPCWSREPRAAHLTPLITAVCALLSLMAALLLAPAAASAQEQAVTRFVIELPTTRDIRSFVLREPERVVIDLPATPLRLPSKTALSRSNLIEDFRYGKVSDARARLVIKTKLPASILKRELEEISGSDWSRLTLEMAPLRDRQQVASLVSTQRSNLGVGPLDGAPQLNGPALSPATGDAGGLSIVGNPSRKPGTAALPMIVLDPGHGGKDSGAKKHGVKEKDVVLKFGKMLRDKLLKTRRYRVHMTRDRDEFVELRRRVQIAKEQRAALFMAIHADYAGGKYARARGATFYTLRPGTLKRMAKNRAKKIKAADLVPGAAQYSSAVRGILRDLGRRWVHGTDMRTNMFVEELRDYMGDATKLRSTPHRTAGFRVLKNAQVPSVLIELAFVSNKKDARLLKSKKWRTKVTKAITKAVDNYFSHDEVKVPL